MELKELSEKLKENGWDNQFHQIANGGFIRLKENGTFTDSIYKGSKENMFLLICNLKRFDNNVGLSDGEITVIKKRTDTKYEELKALNLNINLVRVAL